MGGEKKHPRQSQHSKTELQLTLHNQQNSWISYSFLNTTKHHNMIESAYHSLDMLLKRLLRPINLEMTQFVDLLLSGQPSYYINQFQFCTIGHSHSSVYKVGRRWRQRVPPKCRLTVSDYTALYPRR
jgi:hypothetical protein